MPVENFFLWGSSLKGLMLNICDMLSLAAMHCEVEGSQARPAACAVTPNLAGGIAAGGGRGS